MSSAIAFDNSYQRLPDQFFARLAPTPVRAPRLIRLNTPLAESLGIDPAWLCSEQGVAVLAGNAVPAGAAPIAQAYAGHQFGGFSPQLGDGRAILLGEVVTPAGLRRDIQLKGSGPTPFSRRGDGRAGLGPVLREYLISEAMAALNVPTTRALAAVLTGETILRDRPVPGAVLARVAASHLRIGTFQYFASRGDLDAVRLLADHAIARHDPEAAQAPDRVRAFLAGVVARQAALVAQWLGIGFIHGVMNTDNMSISGETIDYGPCAFMDAYDPATVFSSIDHDGRYAYANQPRIALWNLTRLAETLLPLLAPLQQDAIAVAQAVLEGFDAQFAAAYGAVMGRKIGLAVALEGDAALIQRLLQVMQDAGADFTLTFRALGDAADPAGEDGARTLLGDGYDPWAASWRARLAEEPMAPGERRRMMNAVNPAFIARNHRVEAALEAAVTRQDYGPFEALLALLADPFTARPGHELDALPATPDERVRQTFCGT